jgi:hypothetical protein
VLPKLYGKLANEAQLLARKARGIKIPKRYGAGSRISIRLRSKILRVCIRQSQSRSFAMDDTTSAP